MAGKKLKKENSGHLPSYAIAMRDYRWKNNLSQEELALKLGLKQQTYANIETTRTKLAVEFANNFKDVTGVDLLTDKKNLTTDGPLNKNNEYRSMHSEYEMLKEKYYLKYVDCEEQEKKIMRLNNYITKLENLLKQYKIEIY